MGAFRPVVNRAGNELRNGINAPGAFTGPIGPRANIGIDNENLKALWDAEHQDDPLDL